ncbi:MAG: hypothetical protein ABSA46_21670 [Thermodesulfovibrionales bacterium]
MVTLQEWDRKGIRRAYRTATNRRYFNHEQYLQVIGQKAVEQISIRYCRVSSSGQKGDLASQKGAVELKGTMPESESIDRAKHARRLHTAIISC